MNLLRRCILIFLWVAVTIPSSKSNPTTNLTHTHKNPDIIDECLWETNYKRGIPLHNLTRDSLLGVAWMMTQKYIGAKTDRVLAQCTLDFAPPIERIFEKCWQNSTGERKCNDHSKSAWENLLRNNEHPIILDMKKYLSTNNVTEDTFVDIAIALEAMRNYSCETLVRIIVEKEENDVDERLKPIVTSTKHELVVLKTILRLF